MFNIAFGAIMGLFGFLLISGLLLAGSRRRDHKRRWARDMETLAECDKRREAVKKALGKAGFQSVGSLLPGTQCIYDGCGKEHAGALVEISQLSAHYEGAITFDSVPIDGLRSGISCRTAADNLWLVPKEGAEEMLAAADKILQESYGVTLDAYQQYVSLIGEGVS